MLTASIREFKQGQKVNVTTPNGDKLPGTVVGFYVQTEDGRRQPYDASELSIRWVPLRLATGDEPQTDADAAS